VYEKDMIDYPGYIGCDDGIPPEDEIVHRKENDGKGGEKENEVMNKEVYMIFLDIKMGRADGSKTR